MKTGLIIAVIAYEIIVIVICSAVQSAMEKKKGVNTAEGGDNFALAGRNMGVAVLAPTIALTVLGAAHITGVFEMSFGMGAIAIWFSLAHVIMITVACFATGQWVRHFGITTVPELIQEMYGPVVARMITITMAGQVFGVLCGECQGLAIIISSVSGLGLHISLVIGVIIGVLWVIFAGMKELGSVNLVNSIVMYVGLIIATVAIAGKVGGFGFINTSFGADEAFMTNILGNKSLFLSFAVGQIIAVTFCQSISQMLMQTMMSAKDEKTIRRSIWLAAPLNGIFGVFAVILGLTARCIPEYAAAGAKTAAMTMLVDMLPGWITTVLLAALLAAVLSTFAMTTLTPATMWTNDIYLEYINPEADEKQCIKVQRIIIIITAIFALVTAMALPTILDAISWVFSWVIPVWWTVVFGMFWKRNDKVAIVTLIVSWIMNMVWSFTPCKTALQGVIGFEMPNAYVMLICTLVIYIIGNAVCKGEPGYARTPEAAAKAAAMQ